MSAIVGNRETVGKIASDLIVKTPETRSPIELEREMQKDYMKHLRKCVKKYKKKWDSNFFIVVLTKAERLMPNVFRNYFMARHSCPTPNYDQTVFAYNKKDDSVEYIWSIPSQDASWHLKENAKYVIKEEQQLLNFVLQFENGRLYQLAKMYNGEL